MKFKEFVYTVTEDKPETASELSVNDELKRMLRILEKFEDSLDKNHRFYKKLEVAGADKETLLKARDAIINAQDFLATTQSLMLK